MDGSEIDVGACFLWPCTHLLQRKPRDLGFLHMWLRTDASMRRQPLAPSTGLSSSSCRPHPQPRPPIRPLQASQPSSQDANIRLLFQMQAARGRPGRAPVAGSNATATLQQVCYKPLGDDCATQSILQVSSPWAPQISISMQALG